MNDKTVMVECDAIKSESASGLAILIIVDGEELWIPLSQVASIHRDDDPPRIELSRWIAGEKGLL